MRRGKGDLNFPVSAGRKRVRFIINLPVLGTSKIINQNDAYVCSSTKTGVC